MRGTKEGLRRRAPRVAIELEGSLLGRRRRDVRVLDLSLTGCLVQCDTLLDPGAILDLRLPLETGPFAAKVRVSDSYVEGASLPKGVKRYLAGLEFLGLPAREAVSLRRFLEEQKRRRQETTGH